VFVWLFVCLIINHKLELTSISKSFWHVVPMNAFDREHPNQQYLFHIINSMHQLGIFLSQLHQLCLLLQVGDTPVHCASLYGHLDVVRYLIEECGADVNAKGNVSEF
jgi:hypothetical protein